ncbi:MAG: glycerol-3-phosphate dehydrogenase/oxidase [Bryobacteraceae bacterium]|nr:glycerol-3-phosphate dehydrogenase/oxidase [Bryobacteraceae bacterium]
MSGFSPDLRARTLATLQESPVDVLIIGGGINGAGVARDLCLRQQPDGALKVALVEQRHFASGTSGKNSQLIHGGLRYLKYLKMALVKESLKERATLRRLAPHLVEPLAFLMPIYSRLDKMKFMMGLSMYDQLAGDANVGKHREMSKAEFAGLEPRMNVQGLVGGAVFYDCSVHSARFVLENLFDAAANGALIANHVHAEPQERSGNGLWRVRLEDRVTGESIIAHARKLVDATGAWSTPASGAPRLVRGSHLVLPRLNNEEHAIAYFDDNGRIVFLIPWGSQKQLTLAGTTDVDHKDGPENARISKAEFDYLAGIIQRLYPRAAPIEPICAFSSLRPLVDDGSSSATAASREHKIWNTADGILRIQGGKYTTYRAMSEEAVDLITKEVAPQLTAIHKTASEPLAGNSEKALSQLAAEAPRLAHDYRLAQSDVEAMMHDYGVHVPEVLALLPDGDCGPIRRVDCARIGFAVQHEMALHLSDYFFVSSYAGYEAHWESADLEPYANMMGAWMGWDSARQSQEIQAVLKHVALPR